MPRFLSSKQVSQYHEQGYLSPIDVMSETDAADILAQLEAAELEHPEHLGAVNRNNAHLVLTFLDQLAFNPIVLDAVEDVLGPDFSLWGSVLFIKEPSSKYFVSWHQDATYAGLSSHDYVTPWIALSPSNQETGCMSMIPGSHKAAIRPHEDTYGEDNILTRGQVVADVDESKAVDLILKPGQMSLHHGEIIHGSQPNRSTQRRVGFALQSYTRNDVRQVIGENMWLPVRGEGRSPSDTTVLSRPARSMSAESVALRERVNKNFGDILYHGATQRRKY